MDLPAILRTETLSGELELMYVKALWAKKQDKYTHRSKDFFFFFPRESTEKELYSWIIFSVTSSHSDIAGTTTAVMKINNGEHSQGILETVPALRLDLYWAMS